MKFVVLTQIFPMCSICLNPDKVAYLTPDVTAYPPTDVVNVQLEASQITEIKMEDGTYWKVMGNWKDVKREMERV